MNMSFELVFFAQTLVQVKVLFTPTVRLVSSGTKPPYSNYSFVTFLYIEGRADVYRVPNIRDVPAT